MRIPSSLLRLAAAFVGLLVLAVSVSAQTEVYFRNRLDGDNTNTRLRVDSGPPTGHLPVLFVHGHNPEIPLSENVAPHYKDNWQASSRPSFLQTLKLPENDWLDIEEYYIRFVNQDRSITEDAAEISDAIDLILHRHNQGYDYPRNPAQTPSVQVVIIAFSKGTISTRQYLKNVDSLNQSDTVNPDFRPVSEFIGISPPNHGISTNFFAGTNSIGVKQLYNGMRPENGLLHRDFHCTDSFGEPAATDYFTNLNGHNITDTINEPTQFYASEAPGSRADVDNNGVRIPPTAGTLYVTLFARGERDFVGGQRPSTDCPVADGRKMARNLAEDAVNIEIPQIEGGTQIVGSTPGVVHGNTVHTAEVICLALSAAVNHRSPRSQTCGTTDGKPIIPRAAAMLTLDFSGSMLTPAPPHPTRAAALKEAVELFLQLWSEMGGASDRIGVTYFRTNVEPWNLDGDPLPPLSAGGPAITTNLRNNQEPSGLTAMGGGLQSSIDSLRLAGNTPIRRVILFTDGMQNVNPRVERRANNQLVIANQPPGSTTVLNTLGIPVDTIGIGAGGDFLLMLQSISGVTGGRPWPTNDPSFDLRRFFIEVLINALRGFSPQLVAYRHGALAPAGSTEAFAIENGVRKLVMKVSWQRGNSLDFTVARDGVDVTSAGRFIGGDFYKIFVIDLPASGRIAAGGNWEVRINGKAGTSYEAAAIVDGSPISYDSSFDLKRPSAGEPLDLVVRLLAGGQPVAGTKVSVTLLSPTMTAGDIIAKSPAKDLPAFEPGMSVGERQLLALAQDPKRSAGLKPKPTKLELEPAGKGDFRGRLSTPVPGVYTAVITIEGSSPQLGQFSRSMTMTTVVRFANGDRKASDILATECDAGGGRRYVRVFLTPRDTNGHFMGPGSPSEIDVDLSAGRLVGTTRDLGDGSYGLLLEVPAGDDPNITLKVAGTALFTGRLSRLSGKTRR